MDFRSKTAAQLNGYIVNALRQAVPNYARIDAAKAELERRS